MKILGNPVYLDSSNKFRKFVTLKNINLEFTNKTYSVYHNDSETVNVLGGDITVEVADYDASEFQVFGRKRLLPTKAPIKTAVVALPKPLQDKLVDLWLEVEEEIRKGAVKDGNEGSSNS